MRPYYEDDSCTIYHGDCREILPVIGPCKTLVTEPVWPDASVFDDIMSPHALLNSALEAVPDGTARLAIQIGCDSDPRFLAAVPLRWKFFRMCWLDPTPTTWAWIAGSFVL